jgi:hypothetical protein
MKARAELGERPDAVAAWPLVVRVAGVAAVLAAAVCLALQRFFGVGPLPLVACAAAVALVVGLQLPAAAPAFLQPIDPLDAEIEQLLDELS